MRLPSLRPLAFATAAAFVSPALLVSTAAAAAAKVPPKTAATAAPLGPVQGSGDTLHVKQEKIRLANGFEVILIEDHRLPLVAFNLWVHAGPRNEAKGQTGFAHLFEHLMFAGSRHVPRGVADQMIDAVGGTDSNGSTDFDRTNYFFTLPSNQFELGLWIQSDMLGYMIDEVDAVALANQQDVVRNERRQTTENRPYGVGDEALYYALYPEGHPYRASVIGSHADIQSIQLADVRAFARTYYRPNNATLVLTGDFDAARARQAVEHYYGALKSGGPVPPVNVPVPQITSERRVVVTDQVQLPRLTIAWHTPGAYKPGDADLDVAASVLGGGKSGRLYKKLVYELQAAQSVSVAQSSAALSSVFSIEVVARPGHTLDEIEAVVDAELKTLAQTPPSATEVQRARTGFEAQLFGRMEKVGSLANLINQYNQQAGDPDYLAKDLQRYRDVTPASVSAIVTQYLQPTARVVVQTVPGEQVLAPDVPTPPAPAPTPREDREVLNAEEPWRNHRPAAGPNRPLTLPAGQRFTLPNGLTVVHVPKPGLPLVSATLVLRAGQDTNPADRPGLASFTAGMLDEGTTTRNSLDLADAIADLGADLSSGATRESARLDLSSLRASFPDALTLLADVALHPAFDAAEIERQKASRLAALQQQRESAPSVAALVAAVSYYGPADPRGANPLGTEATINATTRDDLLAFWRTHYRPDQAALVVAGDVTRAELRDWVMARFGDWVAPKDAAAAHVKPPAPAGQGARLVLVDKPGAPQTALQLVGPAPSARDASTPALSVANAAFGGLFTSRINNLLREVKGYTYGISSRIAPGRDDGLFSIRGSLRTDVTGAGLSDLYGEIDRIRRAPLGRDELMRARNSELLSLPGQFDTNGTVASSYATAWAQDLPADYLVKLPGRLAAVDATRAYQAIRTTVDPSRLTLVAVGDKAKVAAQLAGIKRGTIELRNPDGSLAAPPKP